MLAPLRANADAGFVNHCLSDAAPETLPPGALKVLSLNVGHGRHRALNQLLVKKERVYENLDKVAQLLERNALDIVALQESDAASRWSGSFDHVAYLAEKSGMQCRVHGLHSQTWISSYGTALLSRSKPASSDSIRFERSWPSKQKGFVTASFDWPAGGDGNVITFVSVHLDFLRASVRDQQVGALVDHLSEIDGPVVLMGDINSQWEESASHVRTLAEKLGLHAHAPESRELGTYKDASGKRFDWILVSGELEFRDYRNLSDVVSDHLAVYAEIALRQSTTSKADAP